MTTSKLNKLTIEYAQLYAQEQEIKKLRDDMSAKIRTEIVDSGEIQFDSTVGMFTAYTVPVYTFSKKVKDKEAELKELKDTEKQKQIATVSYTPALRFSPKAIIQ